MKNKTEQRYESVKAEWLAIKKDLGTIGFVALILSIFVWIIFGLLTLFKTLQMKFSPQETIILFDVIFFVYGLILIGFLYVHVLRIKNRKLRFK